MSIQTEISTIHELDVVELLIGLPTVSLMFPDTGDIPLHVGDRGTVIATYDDARSFTVEFFRGGETVAITDVNPEQVRRVDETVNAVAL